MTQALWGVLLLSLATGVQAAGDHTGATAPQPNAKAMNSRAGPTTGRTGSVGHAVKPAQSAGRMSGTYKADMAECRSMRGTEQRNCEREMRAARAQGLYRE